MSAIVRARGVAAVAHRGDSSRWRENTLRAVRSALAEGADSVEIDVRLTRDGDVVLLHDPTLERLWGVERAVRDVTLAELRELGGGEERIPLLADVLPLFDRGDALLLIDMETVEPAAAAYDVVARHRAAPAGAEARVAWCGALDALRTIRTLDDAAEVWLPWASAVPPRAEDLADLRPAVVNLHHLLVGPGMVEAVHALGARVSCWTVDDRDQMAWLQRIGVDSITSNRLADLLGSRAEAFGGDDASAATADEAEAPSGRSGEERRRARLVARELAVWAMDHVRSNPVDRVDTKKNPADHVTEVDRAIERGVREVVDAQFPGHRFVGEEYGGEPEAGSPCWYLDPVDGTANLANGVPWTSFSLALVEDGSPVVGVVADPWRGLLVEAAAGEGAWVDGRRLRLAPAVAGGADDPLRGRIVSTELAGHRPWPGMVELVDGLAERFCTTRVMGSGTLTIAGVALGHGSGAVIGAFGPVDHLAAALIVREAGGVVLDEAGRDTLFPERGGILAARDRETADALFALWRDAVAKGASRG
ncbi:Fructose-1,6-bisphosphatase/inositol-1-monophosphatase [Frondihabitans sp. 762G35]|uniref:inositol monophosphatase family protein n=1 Tax=Frondihabitans sp. 762G35 TaxID=1446794 RepID=UPI000D2162D3|nr:inositol monophosphatase family protein [Frondihabitans sp. 762G35]ARC57752.1 Fructose-1,6-bisphosphatase/inositol-1-monophosphatase [Frondihabitans sp. 762G35]